MSDTLRFAMPLLDAAQAQKHVTVNEALVRADALGARRAESRTAVAPPPSPADGALWIVGPAATGLWAGKDGQIAVALNGGWEFVPPWEGATFWLADEGCSATWDGSAWSGGCIAGSTGGAITVSRIASIDHMVSPGPVSITAPVIPDKAMVIGVTGRVIAGVTGVSGWSLGVPGSATRYGNGYGISNGAFAHGVTGQPQAYYGATPLEITAEGGSFLGGQIRLAVHYFQIAPPL